MQKKLEKEPKASASILLAGLGALLVYYNLVVLTYSLPFVGKALFTTSDPIQSSLNVLLLIVGGYLAKPFGQAFFGSLADRHGRKPILIFAASISTLVTLALMFLPSVYTIGVLSPILFALLTMIQAIGSGAEWPLVAIYAGESGPAKHRTLIGGSMLFFVCLGWALAIIIPLALHLLLDDVAYSNWGWRATLAPGVLLGIAIVIIRQRIPETPRFLQVRDEKSLSLTPLRELFRNQAKDWFAIVVTIGMVSAGFFLTVAFPVTFVAAADQFSGVESLLIGLVGLIALVLMIFPFALLGDRFGPRIIATIGFSLLAILSFPIFLLMLSGSFSLACLGAALAGICVSAPASVYEAWLISRFPTRYAGASTMCVGVVESLFGLPSLLLASFLVTRHEYLLPAVLVIVVGVLGAIFSATLMRFSVHKPLN